MDILKPRITFSYPTWIRPGSSLSGPLHPDIAFHAPTLPMEFSFYFSFGMVLKNNNDYSVDVNVFYDEIPLIFDKRVAVDSRMLSPVISNSDDLVFTSVMEMNINKK